MRGIEVGSCPHRDDASLVTKRSPKCSDGRDV